MSLRRTTTASTKNYSKQIEQLRYEIKSASAIILGAGAGLSASAGFSYSGERFERYFSDFHQKYGITDMYSGGFYPYDSLEAYWAWWSRHIWINRYMTAPKPVYRELLALLQNTNYFILTTNVDHQFQLAGFDKKRLFYMQGDYGLWQCSKACHQKTYDNKESVRRMVTEQKNMCIPSELIPRCPICGAPMTMNLRCDDKFVQDKGWYAAAVRYDSFIRRHLDSHILLLELGVGLNTPGIIKYPFWQMTARNPNAIYACVNTDEMFPPLAIKRQSIDIKADIGRIIRDLSASS